MRTKLKLNRDQHDRLSVVSEQTGEVLGVAAMEGDFVFFPKKERFKEAFLMVFLQGLEELAKSPLTGFDYKVLFILMSRCDYENWIVCPPTSIAERLDAQVSAVCRSLRRLQDMGVVERREVIRATKAYRLCSAFGWRGKVASFRAARHEENTKAIEPLMM